MVKLVEILWAQLLAIVASWRCTLTTTPLDEDGHLVSAADGWPCFVDHTGVPVRVPTWLVDSHAPMTIGHRMYVFSRRAVVVTDHSTGTVYVHTFGAELRT